MLQIQQSEVNLKSVKSQLEQVQQEASMLQLQLSSAEDEGNSAKQEVTIVTTQLLHHKDGYRIAGIYYESFNFANFAHQKALAKIKASIYFWINIV